MLWIKCKSLSCESAISCQCPSVCININRIFVDYGGIRILKLYYSSVIQSFCSFSGYIELHNLLLFLLKQCYKILSKCRNNLAMWLLLHWTLNNCKRKPLKNLLTQAWLSPVLDVKQEKLCIYLTSTWMCSYISEIIAQ